MLRVLDMIYNIFLLYLKFWDVFFTDPDPDFSGSDPDPNSEKKSDPNPEKNQDPKH